MGGSPFAQLADTLPESHAGETALSSTAWASLVRAQVAPAIEARLGARFSLTPHGALLVLEPFAPPSTTADGDSEADKAQSGTEELSEAKEEGAASQDASAGDGPLSQASRRPLNRRIALINKFEATKTRLPEDLLRAYVPAFVLANIEAAQSGWLAESRVLSVCFYKLSGAALDDHFLPGAAALPGVNNILKTLQHTILSLEGIIKEFTLDDKGAVLLCGFGAPPFVHANDPIRAVQASLVIEQRLMDLEVKVRVGIATGMVFLTSIGHNLLRREFAMIGSTVNLAARLMGSALNPSVLVCGETYAANAQHVLFSPEPIEPLKLKGFASPVPVFRPLQNLVSFNSRKYVACACESSAFLRVRLLIRLDTPPPITGAHKPPRPLHAFKCA